MLQQYLAIKAQYPDTILFYRMGDFFEMFFEDAETAAQVLGITLTSRSGKDAEVRIPMAGVPCHSASSYLAKLVGAGFRVAICEQTEDPALARGLVRREVVRVVTPGLATEEGILDARQNRYLAALALVERRWGLALADLSTGEFAVAEPAGEAELVDELMRLAPAELLLPDPLPAGMQALAGTVAALLPRLCRTGRPEAAFDPAASREALLAHFRVASLAGFGCEHLRAGLTAAGALLGYLQETQKASLDHLERLAILERDDVLIVDESSRRNLELVQTVVGGKREGSLLEALDGTATPMGARLLRRWLLAPLRQPQAIERRLSAVANLVQEAGRRARLRQALAGVYDLERLNSRVVLGSANGRDLLALGASLAALPALAAELVPLAPGRLPELGQELDPMTDLAALIAASIREEAPATVREGGLIREGYSAELDEIMAMLRDGKRLIAELEAAERSRTGIANLKVGYNRVFGYYLEVTKSQLGQVPADFIRKQTLSTGERFITPDLKAFEAKVLSAQERRLGLEHELFVAIRSQLAAASGRVRQAASLVAELDVYTALAEVASRHRYVRPQVNGGEAIRIREGRHPVIERSLPPGRFVPNDIELDQTAQEVLIVTGPNMAGKSTVLRQTALIVLMAQMGSFVPAAEATIGVVDRIFTRVGAMDDLARGQSTFMVEMSETANILHHATDRSLVILDEIGRGTSTFDGLAIAWAVTEDLATRNGRGVKTIFATHYHELTELALTLPRVKNYTVAIREWNDSIVFLHRLQEGGTSRSYGIQVAALAGVPARVVARAKEILANIEQGELDRWGEPRIAGHRPAPGKPQQLDLFAGLDDPVRSRLQEIQPDRLSPIEALNLLYELKGL
ncbi:MAG: DNA mismatch repair protein MutS [Thermodesulfobacteriota bacterium]